VSLEQTHIESDRVPATSLTQSTCSRRRLPADECDGRGRREGSVARLIKGRHFEFHGASVARNGDADAKMSPAVGGGLGDRR
jgi:hypothetical protein